MMFGLGRYTIATYSVTRVEDGTRDGVAVVRAAGPMRARFPSFDDSARPIVRADDHDVRLALDYELRPEPLCGRVDATFDVRNPDGYIAESVTNAFFQGYRLSRFIPATASTTRRERRPAPGAGRVWGRRRCHGLGCADPEGNLTQFISVSGFDVISSSRPSCSQQDTN